MPRPPGDQWNYCPNSGQLLERSLKPTHPPDREEFQCSADGCGGNGDFPTTDGVRKLLEAGEIILRMVPVDYRVIEADMQALPVERFADLLHEIAIDQIARFILGQLTIEQRESLVVFGGEDYIVASRFFSEACPSYCKARLRLELRSACAA